MSWSVLTTFEHETGEAGKKNAEEKINALLPSGQIDADYEKYEQCEAAKRAALVLLAEGGFANAAEVGVALSGHANEGHTSKTGTVNDSITVNVYIKKYRPVTTD